MGCPWRDAEMTEPVAAMWDKADEPAILERARAFGWTG